MDKSALTDEQGCDAGPPKPMTAEDVDRQWREWCVIEVAMRNPAVSEYMHHWEDRATKAESRIAEVTKERDALLLQAQSHAMEARTANATIAEIYQLCTGATGEPGNWHGAEPVRRTLAARDAELAHLRGECAKAERLWKAESVRAERAETSMGGLNRAGEILLARAEEAEAELAECRNWQPRFEWVAKRMRVFSLDMGGQHSYAPMGDIGRIRGPSFLAAVDAALAQQSGGKA